MARQNYMTISVADTIQDMFNEFVTKKGITKTSALNDVLEMYMIAKDENLYLELKKKYLALKVILNVAGVNLTKLMKSKSKDKRITTA